MMAHGGLYAGIFGPIRPGLRFLMLAAMTLFLHGGCLSASKRCLHILLRQESQS